MKTKTTLPTLSDDPQYAEAAAKLAELRADLAKANDRREIVLSALNAAAINPPQRLDAITAAAYKLLGGDVSTGANASGLREELAELTENRQELDAAVGIQKDIVTRLRGEASKACIAQVLPAHGAMVREIVRCVMALELALTAEHELRDELYQRDISLGVLRPMPLTGLGRFSEPNSRASAYLLECFEHGFIGMDAIPENLKPWARARTAKPVPMVPVAKARRNADGWVDATA